MFHLVYLVMYLVLHQVYLLLFLDYVVKYFFHYLVLLRLQRDIDTDTKGLRRIVSAFNIAEFPFRYYEWITDGEAQAGALHGDGAEERFGQVI